MRTINRITIVRSLATFSSAVVLTYGQISTFLFYDCRFARLAK